MRTRRDRSRSRTATALALAASLLPLVAAQAQVTETLTFAPAADVYVDSSLPDSNFDADSRLRADGTPRRISYLRVVVSGVAGRLVQQAHLRLGVVGASLDGGTIHSISDVGWDEKLVTYRNRPAVDGPALATLGAVTVGSVVEFDVTGAIAGDGVYGFAIDNASDDCASYVSGTATKGQKPLLVLQVAAGPAPVVRILHPPDGAQAVVGVPVAFHGSALDDVEGEMGAALVWTSDLQGLLGTGTALTVPLVPGRHLVTAAVTDHDGLRSTAQVGLQVLPPGSPMLTIIEPRSGRRFATGEPVTFTAVAEDERDGLLSARVQWTSDLDGSLGVGASSTRTLSAGMHRVTALVNDDDGLQAAATIAVDVGAPLSATFTPIADTYVDAANATRRYGSAGKLLADASPVKQVFLRFAVGAIPAYSVQEARLRLTVGGKSSDGSDHGGTLHVIRSNSWSESSTSYRTRPAIDGPELATAGRVTPDQVVDFDVTRAVGVSGVYNFALLLRSSNGVVYRSREASRGKPQLLLTLRAPWIPLDGTFVGGYNQNALEPDTTLDLRGATFLASETNRYPLNLAGGAGVVLLGGRVLGQYDRTWSWDQMHTVNNAAVAFENPQLTVDGLRIDNVTDGIRPQEGGAFTVRNVRMSYVRDDCIENDHLQDGLVEDSLLDGCYVAFSARPSAEKIANGMDGTGKLWRIHRSLVRLEPMPGPAEPSLDGLGHGGFFKWHLRDDPAASLSPKLSLHDNVFLAERVGQVGAERMGVPPGKLASCSNNVMVWLGPGDYPAPLPACFRVTKDRAAWDAAVAAWLARHPDVAP
jgi:hypothetical protein